VQPASLYRVFRSPEGELSIQPVSAEWKGLPLTEAFRVAKRAAGWTREIPETPPQPS